MKEREDFFKTRSLIRPVALRSASGNVFRPLRNTDRDIEHLMSTARVDCKIIVSGFVRVNADVSAT